MAKSALVTGATGQDGSFLMELLLKKGYEVHGLVRRLSIPNIGNIQHLVDRVSLLDGDLIDQSSLNAAVRESEPDEVYNLAAQSFVATSFVQPVLTGEITGIGVAKIHHGLAKTVTLGNLDARRDWGYAPEFVDLMWRVLQHKEPDDFVGATGEAHSVREFVEEAFRVAGISDWEAHVTIDEKNFRPSEIYNLRGDAGKAKRILGWQAKTKFKELAKIMVEADIESLIGSGN